MSSEIKQDAMKTKTLLYFAVIVLLIALTEARGGRGGGRGGGRFSSRSRSKSRSSSRSGTRRFSKFSGNRISTKRQLRTAILSGTVYGASGWRSRNSYWNKGELPEVCYNDRYDKTHDGNSTYQGRFLCPTDRGMRGDKTYCCGNVGQQYCCTFWEDGGRVAGVVIGLLILVGIVSITVYCCIKRGNSFRRSRSFLRAPSKDNYQI